MSFWISKFIALHMSHRCDNLEVTQPFNLNWIKAIVIPEEEIFQEHDLPINVLGHAKDAKD